MIALTNIVNAIEKEVDQVVDRLSVKYGFDASDAKAFLRDNTAKDVMKEMEVEIAKADKPKAEKKPRAKKAVVEEPPKEEAPKAEKKPRAKKAVAEEPPKEEAPKPEEKKTSRFNRPGPALTNQLKETLAEVGLEMTDKLKKEFKQYVDDLTQDDYDSMNLTGAMKAFALLKGPVAPSGGSAKPVEESASNASGGGPPERVSLEKLRSMKNLTATATAGLFQDKKTKQLYTGPDEARDEDVDEVTFEGNSYVVGVDTGRVYKSVSDVDTRMYTGADPVDVFVGFKGVGQFKDM